MARLRLLPVAAVAKLKERPFCEVCGLRYQRREAHDASKAHRYRARLTSLLREGWVPIGGTLYKSIRRWDKPLASDRELGLVGPGDADHHGRHFVRLDDALDVLTLMKPSASRKMLEVTAEAVRRMSEGDVPQPWWRAFWSAAKGQRDLWLLKAHGGAPWWVPPQDALPATELAARDRAAVTPDKEAARRLRKELGLRVGRFYTTPEPSKYRSPSKRRLAVKRPSRTRKRSAAR